MNLKPEQNGKIEFKKFIEEIKQNFISQCETFDKEIEKQFEILAQQDQYYIDLLNSNILIPNQFNQNINSLVDILRKKIENWIQYRDKCYKDISEIQDTLQNKVNDFNQNLLQQLNILYSLKQKSNYQNISTLEVIGIKKQFSSLKETKLQVIYTKNNEMIYLQDGEILRCDEIQDYNDQPQIMKNLEQIRHLIWHGSYNLSAQKEGKWYPTWKGEKIDAGGTYQLNGIKNGQWIELSQNFWDKAQVFEKGKYSNNKRCDKWEFFHNNQLVSEGLYSQNGLKNGRWSDLHDNYHEGNKVILNGEYLEGQKVKKWNIVLKGTQIGGGYYNEIGEKDGNWIELHNNFNENNQIIEQGQYKNGQRIGQWDFKQDGKIIGGGQYSLIGNKDGIWTELHNYYSKDNLICYQGQYQNGKKCNKWKILYKSEEESYQEIIGGGNYSENEIKIGGWIELHEYFSNFGQVVYEGIYSNGKKNQIWDIKFRNISSEFVVIGGGQYDSKGIKQGEWKELHPNFSFQTQIFYKGIYINGKKSGEWEIKLKQDEKNLMALGGGLYDENQLKNGQWIDLYENFKNHCQVRYKGEYYKGKKQGTWQIKFRESTLSKIEIEIGNGDYDENGIKTGEWVELDDQFEDMEQIRYQGKYVEGIKTGIWKRQKRINGKGNFVSDDDNENKQFK
ncbi:unnamed protein product [Paramecium primaurelia]|uniref:Uncharacterized protein n=1 Tax=Paramecium primaurelia TaxID=5886 RepID=A0A8S1N3D1_PARPR|nr:unnamed protein product [Paramecium primaurelia]